MDSPTIPQTTSLRSSANEKLQGVEPLKIVVGTAVTVFACGQLYHFTKFLYGHIQDHGLQGSANILTFKILRSLPGVGAYIEKEQKKVVDKLGSAASEKRKSWATELPKEGLRDGVLERIREIHAKEQTWQGRCSGTVYMGGEDYEAHVNRAVEAYRLFSHTNPLHPDVFPSVAQFEAEVVAMTASMLGGGANAAATGGENVCGNMTSGGSESILMAVKTSRDYMRATKNITAPEMVISVSAHSAYDKAALYFGIRLRRAPVGEDFRADVRAMRRLINRNTIMLVASAPGFPHGVIDPIQELGALALQKRVCFHVDLCLGGFVLPFARKLGYPIPPFDFGVPGVTSMSVDTHKYGLCPKGSSVVLYRNHEIRKHQFVAVTEWSGGLYISPSAAGSRAGGLIAAAWASLMAVGEDGFMDATKKVMATSEKIAKGVEEIEGLQLMGRPEMTVVAFGSREKNLDIYMVNDVMTREGWSLNALQRPPCVHICVTLQHVDTADKFLTDLRDAVAEVRASPEGIKHGMAPIYGMAGKMPDRGTVRDILTAYCDSTC
eukprot:TRINITY_DN19855_c0_g1_i1.p1 TRINITY_DN19855_c0_g1~~TRINITY_DN19855_c0_g1_i1.p1  ORF type:complete len:550 (+),score=74.82 TRINITY_DN19855_c0_g1_i1:451-2100(+)